MTVTSPSAPTARSRDSPHTSSRQPRTTPTPFSPSLRTPVPLPQAMPPLRPTDSRSPFVAREARTPSPNYFGLTVDPAKDYTSPGAGPHARSNWSPPTSNVRSTAAASPRIIPLDQNSELEAFRRQTEINGFTRASSAAFAMAPLAPSRTGSKSFIAGSNSSASPLTSMPPPSPKTKTTATEAKLPEPKQRSPKRLLSSPPPQFTNRPRRNSPAEFNDRDNDLAPQAIQFLSAERDLRLSLPAKSATPSPSAQQQRADTLPAVLDGELPGGSKDGPILVTPQHVVNLLEAYSESILLLDLRVSTQYTRSRIAGALNLCIPTTLLKRPSYNLQRLTETFNHDEEQKRMFERWRSCKYIIVYDSNSSLLKDAFSCMHMLKKFVHEGWSGFQYVIRGGFVEFSKRFPHLVAHDSAPMTTAGSRTMSIDASIAPVVGGCPMPANTTKTAANPFFGNIRQNMDLIGGVGQMPIKQPSSLTQQQKDDLPTWLRLAADPNDEGRVVSEKFLQIEKREQKRMQEALSGKVHYGTPGADTVKGFQIAGIEKGAKNRYNNIWPYEHSRVKLEGVLENGCDYVNANHLKASWSSKRYIATQGPIPATFNDFWNVVWQQDVRVIVMLTAENEGGQTKAHNYWSDKHYGPIHLNFLSEHRASLEPSRIQRHRLGSRDSRSSFTRRRSTNPTPDTRNPPPPQPAGDSPNSEHPYVIVRRFTLSRADEPFERMREITQLQYTNWPDFGAPAHPAHLLGLVEQCDAVVRASYGGSPSAFASNGAQRPVVVHCSAGCGRTGTFCTVDSVIDMLKRQRKDSSARSVRQPTPMDIESSPSRPQMTPSRSVFTFGQPHQNDSGFFTKDDAIEGWLARDDLDLIEKTVEEFRHQRLSAVQSLRQFVLCYEAVLEWLAGQTPKSA